MGLNILPFDVLILRIWGLLESFLDAMSPPILSCVIVMLKFISCFIKKTGYMNIEMVREPTLIDVSVAQNLRPWINTATSG